MSLTRTASAEALVTTDRAAAKVAALASLLLAVALFMTVAIMNVPHELSDSDLITWWQDSGNRMTGVISGMFALLVAITIPVVTNHLSQLDAARRSPHWLSFARSMSAAVTAVWLVTGGCTRDDRPHR